ncbi:MAG: hypothetical protein AABX52_03095 [Nanoarchaeota archaeon]
MDSRAQITIYILTGILILILASLLIHLQQPYLKKSSQTLITNFDTSSVQEYLYQCFEYSVYSTVFQLEEVGSLDPDLDTIPFQEQDVTILVDKDTSRIPSKKELEEQLAYKLLQWYESCEPEQEFPFTIKQDFESATSKVDILSNNIYFEIHVPTIVKTESLEVVNLGTHALTIPSSLYDLHKTAEILAKEFIKEPGSLPIDRLHNLSFAVYVQPFLNKQAVIRLIDQTPKPESVSTLFSEEIPHAYTFGVKW